MNGSAKHASALTTKPGIVARRSARLRLALGTAQMSAAAFALGLLASDGVTARALAAAVIACTLTTVSVLLFGSRRSSK
ncbi:MAG: hypothetical protein ABS36_12620 [Acidobacteria bacterium SCN 69-37]|nr:MAG: hypothetical protein ABS36_12620 [Acidobacteria bacterium SCN 69-37]